MTVKDKGIRVLVVEDEPMIATLLEDMLMEIGCDGVETATRIEDALTAAQGGTFSMAILDVNLNGTESFPVAEILREREIPFVFSTGYGAQGLPLAFSDAPTLQKPFMMSDLEAAVERAVA